MDLQNPNPEVENLCAEGESNPTPEKEENNEVRQRTPAFVQDASLPGDSTLSTNNNENPKQSKFGLKGLESFFGKCYKAWMILNFSFYANSLFRMLDFPISIEEFDRFYCLISVWAMAQYVFAFQGAKRENLQKIEKALMLMMTWIGLIVIYFIDSLSKKFMVENSTCEARYESPRLGFEDFGPLVEIVIFLLFTFIPTRRVRNSLQPPSQNKKKSDLDPIEQLNTWKYIMYKNWALLAFCWIIKSIASNIWEEDFASLLGKMSSNVAFLIWILTSKSLEILFLVTLYLIFQGIRKKNLQQIQRAIRLMKISFILGIINIGSYYYVTKEDASTGQQAFEYLRQKIGDFPSFLVLGFIYFVMVYVCFMLGACKVRDILKAPKNKKED